MFQFLKTKSVHVISVLCVYMCTVHIHTHNEKCRRAEKEMLYPVSVISLFGIFWYLFLFLEICHVYLFCLILESLFWLCFGFSPSKVSTSSPLSSTHPLPQKTLFLHGFCSDTGRPPMPINQPVCQVAVRLGTASSFKAG